jgi:cytochrome c biogenesis protein CcdA
VAAGQGFRQAFYEGCHWGLGHSVGLLVVAFIFHGLGDQVVDLEQVGGVFEWLVGFLMILLGLYTMWTAFQMKIKEDLAAAAAAAEDGQQVAKDSSLSTAPTTVVSAAGNETASMMEVGDEFQHHHPDDEHNKDGGRWSRFKSRLLSFGTGIIHGCTGPGGILGVIPAAELHDWNKSLLYLAVFCLMSIVTMGVFGCLYGALTKRASMGMRHVNHYLRIFSSLLAMVVGLLWVILSATGKMVEVFGE